MLYSLFPSLLFSSQGTLSFPSTSATSTQMPTLKLPKQITRNKNPLLYSRITASCNKNKAPYKKSTIHINTRQPKKALFL
ncbi:hypothetical protein BDV97DRAFT_360520 [Delphinella strobiligena]|nr:hypothetical protein BDV97DRAFT_360520 [Delphinella strobiligena]